MGGGEARMGGGGLREMGGRGRMGRASQEPVPRPHLARCPISVRGQRGATDDQGLTGAQHKHGESHVEGGAPLEPVPIGSVARRQHHPASWSQKRREKKGPTQTNLKCPASMGGG